MIDTLLLAFISQPVPLEHREIPVISRSSRSPYMNGVHLEDSTYRGRFYDPSQEAYRKCVAERESNGHAWSQSKSRTYHGAYQMSVALWRGATYMMTPELKDQYGPVAGKRIAQDLRSINASQAAMHWQTQAFYTVLNWEGKWSGKSHWAGGRWTC